MDNGEEIPWANPTKNPNSAVQVSGNSMMGQYTETNAVLAMVLAALSFVLCGVCSAIPAVIIANGALQITSNQPGHPDHGLARAAQIMGWIAIGLTIAVILFYLFARTLQELLIFLIEDRQILYLVLLYIITFNE